MFEPHPPRHGFIEGQCILRGEERRTSSSSFAKTVESLSSNASSGGIEYFRLPRFRFGSDRLFQPKSCTRSVEPSGRWIVTTVVMSASIERTSRSLLSWVSRRSARGISKRRFSEARSGPNAWRSRTLNNRRSAKCQLGRALHLNEFGRLHHLAHVRGNIECARIIRFWAVRVRQLLTLSLVILSKLREKRVRAQGLVVQSGAAHKPPDS